MPAQTVARVDWNEFLRRFRWYQGEHLSIVGPTNSGKTTLLLRLLDCRRYVVVFATKPYTPDSVLAKFSKKHRYYVSPIWPVLNVEKVVLWPRYDKPGDEDRQYKVFSRALDDIFRDKGRCIAVDEAWYHSNVLGLSKKLEAYWSQGREIGLTVAAATQRPRNVPLMMYSQATHLFFYRTGDEHDRDRVSEIGNANTKTARAAIDCLGFREFLYINAASGEMLHSKVKI